MKVERKEGENRAGGRGKGMSGDGKGESEQTRNREGEIKGTGRTMCARLWRNGRSTPAPRYSYITPPDSASTPLHTHTHRFYLSSTCAHTAPPPTSSQTHHKEKQIPTKSPLQKNVMGLRVSNTKQAHTGAKARTHTRTHTDRLTHKNPNIKPDSWSYQTQSLRVASSDGH